MQLDKYKKFLVSGEADAILLTSEVNRRYAAGFNISEGMALITDGECRYYTDSRYIEAAEKGLPNFSVRLVDREHNYVWHLQQAVVNFGISVLAYEEEYMTAGELQRLEDALEIGFMPVQGELSEFRQVKTAEELRYIERAQQITDKTFEDILSVMQTGMSEKELKTELIYRLCKNGGDEPAFDPVVVSGPNTSMPHGVAGARKLQTGDFVTLDFGCKIEGYCSDMTRTVALGSATEEMRRVYDTVLQAQMAGIAATRAGLTGCEVDLAARNVIQKAGYGEYFGHGYGHGVGLEIHEQPNCSPSWSKPLPAGCVCSAEPGIYLPGKFGVRIEDMVVITDSGCRNLTKSPKSLIIL